MPICGKRWTLAFAENLTAATGSSAGKKAMPTLRHEGT
jgi:hypothetical protein